MVKNSLLPQGAVVDIHMSDIHMSNMTQRTTIRLKGELLAMAKKKAAEQGRTLTALIEDAVRAEIGRPKPLSVFIPIPKSTGGVREGVDINNNAATRDLMDDL